jgi:ATP-dependent Clp protease protease subunit
MDPHDDTRITLGSVFVVDCVGDLTTETLRTVLALDLDVRRARPTRPGEPRVLIRIASRGGDTDIGAAMYQLLSAMPAEIVTLGYGSVSSAATIVFCAGRRRLLAPGTRVVYHAPQWHPEGSYTVEEQRNVLAVSERRFDFAAQVLAHARGVPVETAATDLAAGLMFSADDAVAAHLATAIASSVEFEPRD